MKNSLPDASKRVTRVERVELSTFDALQPALTAARNIQIGTGRYVAYTYLIAVYRTIRQWKRRRISRKMARRLASQLNISHRKGTSPFRILIEATMPNTSSKEKSRWVRALQYASFKDVSPSDLRKFFEARHGIAGCARLAAKHDPRQNRQRDDWADDPVCYPESRRDH